MCDPILITLLKIRPHYGQSKHTRHCIELKGNPTKGQTSQVIDMQLCTLSITCYRIGCRKRTLTFRSFISGFAASDFTGFGRIPMFTMGKKVEIVSLVILFLWDHLAVMSDLYSEARWCYYSPNGVGILKLLI